MDKLRKLLQDDLPRLSTYFLDMTAVQGDGVLLVNYYPNDAIAQMEAKFLKASVIPKWARQMGLADLLAQFEAHDRQTQMVVAVVTPETKGTVTVEVSPTSPSEPEPETPAPPTESAAPKPKAKGKTPARTTTASPEPEPKTPASSARSTTKPKAKSKSPTRTTATSPEPEPETPKPEMSAPPAKPAIKHKARRNPTRTPARRRKAT